MFATTSASFVGLWTVHCSLILFFGNIPSQVLQLPSEHLYENVHLNNGISTHILLK